MTPTEMLLAPFAYMPPPRVLDGLDATQASRTVEGLPHSVVEVLAHLVFWQQWLLDRASGQATPMAAHAADGWPSAGAADWERLRQEFVAGLERAVAIASDGAAAARPVTPAIEFPPLAEYTVSDAMTHLAIHNAHHLGQIVTLRQLLRAWPPPEGSWTW